MIGGDRFQLVRSARITSCGLDEAGAAWCWGANGTGEVGTEPVGAGQRFDEPSAVSGGLRFQTIVAGNGTYCGITTAGTTACWGRGLFGELGSGAENSTLPIPVPIPEG